MKKPLNPGLEYYNSLAYWANSYASKNMNGLPGQGTLTEGKGSVQLISLYKQFRSAAFEIENIIYFSQNKLSK